MMKSTFYFTLEAHAEDTEVSVLTFWSCRKTTSLKNKVNFKIMTSWSGWQTIATHKLPNISTSKGNQTMKFCQLIRRNIFFEKSCTKFNEQTIPRLFSKKSRLSIFLDQVLCSLFLMYTKFRAIEIYWN